MSLFINTNIASLYAQNNVANSQNALATSIQRLSSGLRINSAKDDAAGMAIAARMTSQIGGMTQAAQNANDGISLAQTAEGALAQVTSDLQTMRNLAVQAANGTNSAGDRASIQASISQLQSDINQISANTQYNGLNLLDGSLSNVQFQVGSNAGQVINASVASSSATVIGNFTIPAATISTSATANDAKAGTTSAAFIANNVAAGTLTISGNGSSSAVTVTAGDTIDKVVAGINAGSATTGVAASASSTATLGGFAAGSVSLTLRSFSTTSGANSVTVASTLNSSGDLTGLSAAINAQSGKTGITAAVNATNNTIVLTQAQGMDIGVQNNTTSTTLTVTGATSTVTLKAAGVAGDTATVGGTIKFLSSAAFAAADGTTGTSLLGAATVSSTLQAVSGIDVTKLGSNGIPTGANDALSVVDSAINYINGLRANLGALQNRFSNAQASLTTTSTNMQQARSRIQDTDFASETANLTHNQILQQAGTAMLAQANALPNSVLTLLK